MKGQRKYNIALFIIASTDVLAVCDVLSGAQAVALLTGVGLGYGLFNRWRSNTNDTT